MDKRLDKQFYSNVGSHGSLTHPSSMVNVKRSGGFYQFTGLSPFNSEIPQTPDKSKKSLVPMLETTKTKIIRCTIVINFMV